MRVIIDANEITAALKSFNPFWNQSRWWLKFPRSQTFEPTSIEHTIKNFGLHPMKGIPTPIRIENIDVLYQPNLAFFSIFHSLKGPVTLSVRSHQVEWYLSYSFERANAGWELSQHISHGCIDRWFVDCTPPFNTVAKVFKHHWTKVDPSGDVFFFFKTT